MRHQGTKTMETERLLLRAFEEGDAAQCYANWCSDQEMTRYLRWKAHGSLEETGATLRRWAEKRQDPSFYQWAIVLKETKEIVGTISVVGEDAAVDLVRIGYCIGSRWWHRGIVSEAFGALIPFFFEEVGVNRIEARHDPANPRSGSVMKRCGLTYEGTLRQADVNNQGVVDVCIYSLLRGEWEEGKRLKELHKNKA